ncbi:MAG: signal peptide-domain containing protein [Myxococcota bacterium]|nr:signal peptide-domain containing protein [Myxococcota bacterium]
MRNPCRWLVLATLILCFSAISGTARAAEHETGQKIVVHLSHYTDNLHAVSMALSLSSNLQEGGASVTLFLDLEGVRLADARSPKDLRWGTGPSVFERLDSFLKAGGSVLLCGHCASAAGIDATKLREGARIGTDAEVREAFLGAQKVIDY